MDVDLNIENYNLDDLLNLFKLKYEFTEKDLKNVKKQVLKTHPDKSGLDKKYFLFFTKAYKMIMQIYYFRGKKDFDAEFNKKKKECRKLALINNISEVNNMSGTNLSRDKLSCYNSNIFSKLGYEDLKKAHTETVVPVTHEDFEKKRKFNSVEEYIQHRGKDGGKPLSMEESKMYLNKMETESNKVNMGRAYNLLKRDEELGRINEKWWKNFKLLK